MGDDILDAILSAIPLPVLAIDGTERIIAANAEALTLIGQQARGRNYVTMLRRPAVRQSRDRCWTRSRRLLAMAPRACPAIWAMTGYRTPPTA